jgi:hypothetical protein
MVDEHNTSALPDSIENKPRERTRCKECGQLYRSLTNRGGGRKKKDLPIEQILEDLKLPVTLREVAKDYGVSPSTIYAIKKGWRK